MITGIENRFWIDLEYFIRCCDDNSYATETEKKRLLKYVRDIISEMPKDTNLNEFNFILR